MRLLDRWMQSVGSGPGTGTVTLSTAQGGFLTLTNAGGVSGDVVRYLAQEGGNWEIGWGIYTSSGPTLTRNLILSSSGSLISFGSAVVFTSAPAADDSLSGMRNRFINGDQRLSQRYGLNLDALNVVGLAYVTDRWAISGTSSTQMAARQTTTVPSGQGLQNSLRTTTISGFTTGSTDAFWTGQIIEGVNVNDLQWGTAQAQPLTFSFWDFSPAAGTYALSVTNYPSNNRSYVATYILAASTWTFVTITIPGDTSGTWGTSSSTGVAVRWDMGSGSSFRTTANTWGAGNFTSVTGAVNFVSFFNASRFLTGLQGEAGYVPTPLERRAFAAEKVLAERYYWKTYDLATLPGTASSPNGAIAATVLTNAASGAFASIQFPVEMRAVPTPVFYAWNSGTSGNWSINGTNADTPVTANSGGTQSVMVRNTGTPGVTGSMLGHVTLDAEMY